MKNMIKRKGRKKKKKGCDFLVERAPGGVSVPPEFESGFKDGGLMPHGSLVTTEHIPIRK